MAFSKLKAFLRKAAERGLEGLWNAIGRLVDLITPAKSTNFFNVQVMNQTDRETP
jgi:hypothetical protein